jgi:hypothetical protein
MARLYELMGHVDDRYEHMQQLRDQYTQASEEGTKAETEALRAYEAEVRRVERAQAEADRLRHKQIQDALRDEQHLLDQQKHLAQQRLQEAQDGTTQIIGNLTSVFTQLANGQADAQASMEMLLASFLQYIGQRATVEALAQVALAVGSYPDPVGIAEHAAAAGLWGAVAVAAGVGAGALQSDAAAHMNAMQSHADSAPASPYHDPHGGGGGGSNTYVINWNAPIVTGRTEAQMGRQLVRVVQRATQRYGE